MRRAARQGDHSGSCVTSAVASIVGRPRQGGGRDCCRWDSAGGSPLLHEVCNLTASGQQQPARAHVVSLLEPGVLRRNVQVSQAVLQR